MRQLITAIIIAIIAVIFALQNSDLIKINFFIWSIPETSLALVLLITLVLGILVGLLSLVSAIYRRNKTISSLKKRIGELENAASAVKSNLSGS